MRVPTRSALTVLILALLWSNASTRSSAVNPTPLDPNGWLPPTLMATLSDGGGCAVLAGSYPLTVGAGGLGWLWTGTMGGRQVTIILSTQPEAYLLTITVAVPAGATLVWEQRTNPQLPFRIAQTGRTIPFGRCLTAAGGNPLCTGTASVVVN